MAEYALREFPPLTAEGPYAMLQYPLAFAFKIIAIAPQVKVTDAAGQTVLYVRQKVLALRENVRVFGDEGQKDQLFEIQADRILDFSARYAIRRVSGEQVGTVQRHGMRSLWSTSYTILDAAGQEVGRIHEENAWIKVLDGLVDMIPLVGGILSYLINPAYLVDVQGQSVLRFQKRPSFFERRFELQKLADVPEQDEMLLLNSILMMVLMERDRG